jgi:hypothetical protein
MERKFHQNSPEWSAPFFVTFTLPPDFAAERFHLSTRTQNTFDRALQELSNDIQHDTIHFNRIQQINVKLEEFKLKRMQSAGILPPNGSTYRLEPKKLFIKHLKGYRMISSMIQFTLTVMKKLTLNLKNLS